MNRVVALLVLLVGLAYIACAGEANVDGLSTELQRHVKAMADGIGERGVYKPDAYRQAADYIISQLITMGYTKPRLQTYQVGGMDCHNIEVSINGEKTPEQILVVGAHYDTVPGCPGADDNTSGVAGLLSLARMLKDSRPACTIRFVAFANEEPPYFQSAKMGSMMYAKACKDNGNKIIGMFSLETIGYYTDEPNSQHYPDPYGKMYPPVGNFIAFVANVESADLLKKTMAAFRKSTDMPCEGAAVPDMAPGIGWSDHWSFWQNGYPAVMVTDTAPFRYHHYHRSTDTPEKLDYAKMAKVVEGLKAVILDLTE